VIPALIRRFHEAKMMQATEVMIWGTGTPKREFLYVDDMAQASVFVMNLDRKNYGDFTSPMLSHINVGYGEDISILELAYLIKDVVGFEGQITLDSTKPDGTPRKLMDISRLQRMGWQPKIDIKQGLQVTYADYVKKLAN
jgi:GDP-L-fucose synthase